MPRFKKGDRVRVVNDRGAEGHLDKGRIYEVKRFGPGALVPTDNFVFLTTDRDIGWNPDRFELVADRYGNPAVEAPESDAVNSPQHYKFTNGAEVIDISENLTANAAQALQYIARSSRTDGNNKGETVQDLEKAAWFIARELKRVKASDGD